MQDLINPTLSPALACQCKAALDTDGIVIIDQFLSESALSNIIEYGAAHAEQAFFTAQPHNVYLAPPDTHFAADHPRNIEQVSSKGCLTDDQIGPDSPLRRLYEDKDFVSFLCQVLGVPALFPYADPLSSINLHFAYEGQELGWHFDNSAFAITLLIRSPQAGGRFEYVPHARDSAQDDMGYERVASVLSGAHQPLYAPAQAGSLMLFRGRDALHRVTPSLGSTARMLAVLAYNERAGVALSESARLTFYGRLG